MKENQLRMNVTKTEFTVIGASHNLRKNIIDNMEIGKKNKNSLSVQN